MKRILLTCTVLAAMGSVAHAQIPVTDGVAAGNAFLSLGNQARELAAQATDAAQTVVKIDNQIASLIQLKQTFDAVAHGNLSAVSQLMPELNSLGINNPLGSDASGLMSSMGGLASAAGGLASSVSATGNVAQSLLSTDQLYAPTGSDFRAMAMNAMASGAASQKAIAQTAAQTASDRIAALTSLRSSLASTADLKASTDAVARLTGEQALATAQGNQLSAILIMQHAQDLTDAQRELQAWRCSAEALVKEASGTATQASGGAVMLVSDGGNGGSNCAVAAPPAIGAYVSSGNNNNVGTLVSATGTDGGSGDGATLNKMLAQPWGQQAANNATALGVNPAALAATCSLESNCTSNPGGTGTISGSFQMSNGTFAQTVGEVQASNPGLASSITSKNDPASQSIASAQYLKDGAQSLQAAGISNPSVLDVRGYYQFGPSSAATLASAPDNQVMSSTVNFSAATLAANGITPGVTTVGQWRSTVVNKIGAGTASQSVLIGANA